MFPAQCWSESKCLVFEVPKMRNAITGEKYFFLKLSCTSAHKRRCARVSLIYIFFLKIFDDFNFLRFSRFSRLLIFLLLAAQNSSKKFHRQNKFYKENKKQFHKKIVTQINAKSMTTQKLNL